jgi:hypothetical protein
VTEYRLHGPPGCGKSHALANKWIPRAVEKFGEDDVVVCSLTKTAAAEIASRDLKLPDQNVGTLHAIAYRSLGSPDIADTRLEEWNEHQPAFALQGASTSLDDLGQRGDRGRKADELASIAQVYRHRMTPRDRWRPDVLSFQTKWEDWLQETGYVDFTGLIEQALDSGAAPGDPQVFVVDEAQDSSTLELALVRSWAKEAEFAILAGDGDQSIYSWRGASPEAFLGEDIPPQNNYHLKQSYRVPRAIHRVASKWIEKASYRYAVEYEPRDFEGEVILSHRGSSRAVEPVLDQVYADLENGKTVMLLASCAFSLSKAIAKLREDGILFHNPYRLHNGAWNPLRGGFERLNAFMKIDPSIHKHQARLWTWGEMRKWMDLLKSSDCMNPKAKKLIRQKDGTRARYEVMSPADALDVFRESSWRELRQHLIDRKPIEWLKSNMLASKKKLMSYSFAIAEQHGSAALLEEPRLVVGTIHSTKGGECDSCYLFPDLSPSGAREASNAASRDGVIRTFYVGMTRAREKLVLCSRWSPSSVSWGTA